MSQNLVKLNVVILYSPNLVKFWSNSPNMVKIPKFTNKISSFFPPILWFLGLYNLWFLWWKYIHQICENRSDSLLLTKSSWNLVNIFRCKICEFVGENGFTKYCENERDSLKLFTKISLNLVIFGEITKLQQIKIQMQISWSTTSGGAGWGLVPLIFSPMLPPSAACPESNFVSYSYLSTFLF